MSLQTRLEALVAAIGADVKALQAGGGGGGTAGTKVTAMPAATTLDGTELLYASQGGVSKAVPTSLVRPWNEQVTTVNYVNATLTGTDVFTGFTPVANTRYLIDVLLLVQANAATTGVQTALAGPTAGVTRVGIKINSAATATTDMISHLSAFNTYQVAVGNLATPNLLYMQAIANIGAAPSGGNIRVMARSEVAIANAVTIFPGSSMRWRVI